MSRISYLFAHHIVIIALVTACSSPQGNKSTVPDEKEVETLVDDLYGVRAVYLLTLRAIYTHQTLDHF